MRCSLGGQGVLYLPLGSERRLGVVVVVVVKVIGMCVLVEGRKGNDVCGFIGGI